LSKIKVAFSPNYSQAGFYDEATNTYLTKGGYGNLTYEFDTNDDLTGIKRRIRVGHLLLISAPESFELGSPDSGDQIYLRGLEASIKVFDSSGAGSEQLQQELDQLKTENGTLKQTNETLTKDKQSLTGQVTNLTSAKAALEQESAAKDDTIASLNARIAELEAQLAEATTPEPTA